MGAVYAYFPLLLATLVLEVPVAWLLAPRTARRRTAVTAVCLNLVSHPACVLLLWSVRGPYWGTEVAVLLAEALGYRFVTRLGMMRALLIATVANVISVVAAIVWWS